MNRYSIITKESKIVRIDAEGWYISDDKKRVIFSIGNENTAVFVLDNIAGFVKEFENN